MSQFRWHLVTLQILLHLIFDDKNTSVAAQMNRRRRQLPAGERAGAAKVLLDHTFQKTNWQTEGRKSPDFERRFAKGLKLHLNISTSIEFA